MNRRSRLATTATNLLEHLLVFNSKLIILCAQQGSHFTVQLCEIKFIPFRNHFDRRERHARTCIRCPDFLSRFPLAQECSGARRGKVDSLGEKVLAQPLRLGLAQLRKGIVSIAGAGLSVPH